jgi:hypothetical protein
MFTKFTYQPDKSTSSMDDCVRLPDGCSPASDISRCGPDVRLGQSMFVCGVNDPTPEMAVVPGWPPALRATIKQHEPVYSFGA